MLKYILDLMATYCLYGVVSKYRILKAPNMFNDAQLPPPLFDNY